LVEIELTNQSVNVPYAELAMRIAQDHGLDGKPLSAYKRLLNECGQNLRMALSRIEAGEMLVEKQEPLTQSEMVQMSRMQSGEMLG
ncbi:MAG TPA: hypothetical protein VGZ47_21815, partial [Gemmataceae bacterium]|nr:hypothetical protein [Gemmataceae bacterium]